MVWLGTCLAATFLGLDVGLAVGLGVELISVIFRVQLSVSGQYLCLKSTHKVLLYVIFYTCLDSPMSVQSAMTVSLGLASTLVSIKRSIIPRQALLQRLHTNKIMHDLTRPRATSDFCAITVVFY